MAETIKKLFGYDKERKVRMSPWWARPWRISLVLELGQMSDDELTVEASNMQRGTEWWSSMCAAEIARREAL